MFAIISTDFSLTSRDQFSPANLHEDVKKLGISDLEHITHSDIFPTAQCNFCEAFVCVYKSNKKFKSLYKIT